MPGPLRRIADGLLYHALNRGNNRAAVFFGPDDYRLQSLTVAHAWRCHPKAKAYDLLKAAQGFIDKGVLQ